MILTTGALFIAGLAATAIPIIAHLLSRGKPKKTIFPALRFTKARITATNRRLKAKRFLLLALRVAFCVLLGLTLSRPFFEPDVESGVDVGQGGETPVGRDGARAALVVVDASPRMGRVKNNATLFDRARDTATAIISQAPSGSEIAILSNGTEGDAFLPDRFAAKERLEKLAISTTGRTAGETLAAAIDLSSRSSLGAREIFVLTDGAKAGWSARDFKAIRRAYENATVKPTIYYLDLGDSSYRNASITDATLSSETIAEGNTLRLDVAVDRFAEEAGDVVVEALVYDANAFEGGVSVEALIRRKSDATRRETQELRFESGRGRRECAFNVSGLTSGTWFGVVHIVGADALAVDDGRAFVVKVETERKALAVAPEPTEETSLFLTQALSPDELASTGRAPFNLKTVPYEFGTLQSAGPSLKDSTLKDLSEYQAIFLLDPPPFDAATLEKLATYVKEGGGLGIFLGRNYGAKVGYEKADATTLLGCVPTSVVSLGSQVVEIAPRGYDAPILGGFRNYARFGIPWDALPTSKYWRLDNPASTATVVADFQNEYGETQTPALVENEFGLGLVATLATPISDQLGGDHWNELASGEGAWVFIELMDGIAGRLTTGASSILNYSTGELASIRSPTKEFPSTVTVSTPSGNATTTPGDVERRRVRYPGAKEPGIYRVKSSGQGGAGIDEAFATSIPGEVFDMTRYEESEFRDLWGEASYSTLDPDSILGELAKARRDESREPYGLLAVTLAALFLCETWASNRFYKS